MTLQVTIEEQPQEFGTARVPLPGARGATATPSAWTRSAWKSPT